MRARLALALALTPVAPALAQPAVTLDGCGFDTAALNRALAQEGATTATVQVTCSADGMARLTITTSAGPRTRQVDLRDVPLTLAPRVVALVATALEAERAAPPPLPPAPPTSPPAPATSPRPAPTAIPIDAPGRTAPDAAGLAPIGRASLFDRPRDRHLAAVGRALVRGYGGLPLWGAGAGVGRGPVSLGVHAAGTRLEHRLGQVTPWLVGVDAAVTIACSRARPSTCVGARIDLSRQTVAATSADPAVMATSIATTAIHGAAELSFALPVAGAEVIATAAVGAGSGLVARANSSELVSLAGWTFGGAIEVRR